MGNLENKYGKYDPKQINTPLNATTRHISSREKRKQIFSLQNKFENWPEELSTKISVSFWQNSGIVPTSDTIVIHYSMCILEQYIAGLWSPGPVVKDGNCTTYVLTVRILVGDCRLNISVSSLPGFWVDVSRLYTIIITIYLVHL